MRIGAYFGDISPESGGGYTFQDEVLKALINKAKDAHHHQFFMIGSSNCLQKYFDNQEVPTNLNFLPVKEINFISRIIDWLRKGFLPTARLLKSQGPLGELAKKNNLDLIWFIAGGSYEMIDTPYIATVWDLQHRLQPWFPEVSENGVWASRELQYQYFLARAAYIVVGTEAGLKEVNSFYSIPEFRIKKLPHPTPNFVSPAETNKIDSFNKYNLPSGYIFYPAQFWPHKNHINLLHAIKIIKDKYQLEIPLVLVGSDKGNANHVKKIAEELNLSQQLHILGFVPQEDMLALYRDAIMLTYVSLCGPENLPPLEAFAIGCPVLASNVSGSHEQFDNAVQYCDPSNPQDMASNLIQLYNDPKLREDLVHKGKIRASAWTSEDFVTGIIDIIDEFEPIRRNWN